MPNLQSYGYGEIMALFDEAVRTIPGYNRYNPDKEVKALIDYESTKDNYAIEINDCMVLRGKRYTKKSQFIEELVTEKLGKAPRKDATACSIVFTLPRGYMEGHDFGLTEEEHTALQKSFEDNDTMPDDTHERALLLSARQKLTHLEWSDEEKEKIVTYFETAVHALCKICGIKREDVLYAVVHMDESMPHLHYAFLPMQYGREAYEQAKAQAAAQGKDIGTLKTCEVNGMKIPIYREKNKAGQMVEKFSGLTGYEPGAEERPFGCGSKRFKKGFLHGLNGSLEKEMEARGITTQIATGKGQAFRVREHGKVLRENQVLAERAAELAKERARIAEGKLRVAEERARRAEEKQKEAEESVRIAEEKQKEAEEQARQAEKMAAQAQAAKEMTLETLDSLNDQMHGLVDKLWKELADILKELLGEFFRKIRGAKKKELDVIEKETKAQATEQAKRLIWKRFKPINDMVEEVEKAKKKLDAQGAEMYHTYRAAEQETEYEME